MAEKAIDQAGDEALHQQADEESNSIAIIIQHMAGNMLSRWADFYTTDGEKEWRNRDGEFIDKKSSRQELLDFWEKGWACCLDVIDHLTPEDLSKTIYIRQEAHTVMDAINRQAAHYAYHVGQIVYLCRMYRKADWQTLSIARNKSVEFNKEKGNFTGEHK